jgi:hypothetical protein
MNPRPARQRPGGKKTLTPAVEHLHVGDTPPAQSQTPEVPESQTVEVPNPRRVRAGSEDKPKYQQMLRTEARLRPDQVTALTSLRRRVSANRDDKSERITDNTLVRVAVDLLLARADDLTGDTEDQLRESVTSKLTD